MGFEDQKQALQGLWGQSGREQLQWLVEDEVAIMVWKGSRRARSFKLTPGQTGELVWGSGKFVLDPSFAPGQKTAIWLSGEDNSVSFTWEFLSSEGPSKEGAPMPRVFRGRGLGESGKGRGKGLGRGRSIAKGRGKSKDAGKGEPPGNAFGGKKGSIKGQKGGKSQGFMRHIDRADGIPRTYEEMLLLYSAYWSRLDILAYFMECVEERGKGGKGGKDNWGKSGKAAPPSKGGKGKAGKAGKAATGGKGPKGATLEPAKVNDSKRMDPADGRVYAWEELRAFYAPTYTKKQTEAYWERCTPIAGNAMKGKGKAVLARMAAQSKGKSYAKG